jgi:dCMP deaminase
MNKWNKRFIDLADHIASWSNDPHRKVGAVIINDNNVVLSVGYNGFPRKCKDNIKERYEKPLKFNWMIHSEQNAILNAAYNGIKTKDTIMYINWFPCAICAGQIINAGIKKIVCSEAPDFNHKKYGEEFKISIEKLQEANVEIVILEKNNE